MARILVCDDEPAARRGIVRALGRRDHFFTECGNGRECLEVLSRSRVDLVLLDLRMPVMDGRAALAEIVRLADPPPVVVLTADDAVRTAIEAVHAGAADYLAKPYDVDELRFVVDKTLATARLRAENRRLDREVTALGGGSQPLLGDSPAMRAALEAIERVAPTRAGVLFRGETGTGKEVAARRLHQLSRAAAGPFLCVNCAAIPAPLVESELFGHRRGAFTGADRDRAGRFREADGGTLLLDEVGDMPLDLQPKLLRVLEGSLVEPLGGGPAVPVDVRVVAATHRDLQGMVDAGQFREDLLFRLRVVEIELPPLRSRDNDVVLLAEHFLKGASPRSIRLTPEARAALLSHRWPGNVRELRNAIERAAIFSRGGVVRAQDLPAEVRNAPPDPAVAAEAHGWDRRDRFATAKAKVIERFERAVLEAALREHRGNLSAAARSLGLHRQNFQQKVRKYGFNPAEFR